jgi:hypothetical protein
VRFIAELSREGKGAYAVDSRGIISDMGSAAEWESVLKIGALFAILTTLVDAYAPRLFRAPSRLPRSWTFPLLAGYFFVQACLGLWFGMAMTFSMRALHGLLAVVFAASFAGLLVSAGLFARAVGRRNA